MNEVYNFDAFGRHVDVFLLEPEEVIPLHQHAYRQIVFLAKGEIDADVGLGPRRYAAPARFILDPQAIHGFRAITDAVLVNVIDGEVGC